MSTYMWCSQVGSPRATPHGEEIINTNTDTHAEQEAHVLSHSALLLKWSAMSGTRDTGLFSFVCLFSYKYLLVHQLYPFVYSIFIFLTNSLLLWFKTGSTHYCWSHGRKWMFFSIHFTCIMWRGGSICNSPPTSSRLCLLFLLLLYFMFWTYCWRLAGVLSIFQWCALQESSLWLYLSLPSCSGTNFLCFPPVQNYFTSKYLVHSK